MMELVVAPSPYTPAGWLGGPAAHNTVSVMCYPTTNSQKQLGGKTAPKLVYFVLRKVLLNPSDWNDTLVPYVNLEL